jgi:hypothetical protein
VGCGGDLLQRIDDAGGGLGVNDADDVKAILGQRGSYRVGIQRAIELDAQMLDLGAADGEPLAEKRTRTSLTSSVPLIAGRPVPSGGRRSAWGRPLRRRGWPALRALWRYALPGCVDPGGTRVPGAAGRVSRAAAIRR